MLVLIGLILATVLILSVVLKEPVTQVVADIKEEFVDKTEGNGRQPVGDEDNPIPRPNLDVQLLTPNKYSRPGYKIDKIKDIVIHYTANPGSSAQNNRDYFEGLKDNHYTMASSHFIVGIDGEIIQCIPTTEYSYASNERNKDTISIENCYINEDGSFEKETYNSLVHLTAWLIVKFGLEPDNIIRHYDVTGKICPKYFVENEKAWKKFKRDVKKYINKYIEDY
ncbi:MAG: N-acetylmuramoyl-L-alanine amidase [Lachnospiraceae bacterium]|nr:N-acetylmuramoyl-L-alanine amidase [Lachnospiraceae bacterium]